MMVRRLNQSTNDPTQILNSEAARLVVENGTYIYNDPSMTALEEFGLARLEELVIRHQQESASAMLDAIYQTILAFGSQSRWQDDVTVVIINKVA